MQNNELEATDKTDSKQSSHQEVVSSICEAFERNFRENPRPQIEEYVEESEPLRSQSLLALVHSELELRLRNNEPAELFEYLIRYPELKRFPKELSEILATEVKLRMRFPKASS